MSFPGGAELFERLRLCPGRWTNDEPLCFSANKNEMDGCGTDIASLWNLSVGLA